MDQGLATVVAASVAAEVAAAGYVATQAAVRRERRAVRFAEAVMAIYRYADSPSRIFCRSTEESFVRQQLADDHSIASTAVRYHLNLMRVEAPLVGESYFDVFSRVRRLGPVFWAWAWRHRPAASDAEMQVPPPFYYDFDPEFEILIRCMRVEQSFWPRLRQRRQLHRKLVALRRRRSDEEIPSFAELDRRRSRALSDLLTAWEGTQS